MNKKNATYREQGKTYYSDTCEPLVKAWQAGKVQLEAWARLSYPGYPIDLKLLPGINTIGYWDAQFPQEWGLDYHRNEGIEITFLETGSMSFSMEEDDFILTSDDFTITRPWQLHKVGNPYVGVGKLHWLILDVGVRHPHQNGNGHPGCCSTKKILKNSQRCSGKMSSLYGRLMARSEDAF